MNTCKYEVFAIRYAAMERNRIDNFIVRDPHDGPMPMDYFVWALRSEGKTVLVDTGFSAAAGLARNRNFLRCPIEALKTLGIAPDSIKDVVITHLHYDHAGNIEKLPNAKFHIQRKELEYTTGPCMCHDILRHAYSVEDVVQIVRKLYANSVNVCDGDVEIMPGIQLKLIGGHTRGLQAVRVFTERGWVVLASDASHYYENIERSQPFPIVDSVADMLNGYEILRKQADSFAHIVPGHDPEVLKRYPLLAADPVGIACLHKLPGDPKRTHPIPSL